MRYQLIIILILLVSKINAQDIDRNDLFSNVDQMIGKRIYFYDLEEYDGKGYFVYQANEKNKMVPASLKDLSDQKELRVNGYHEDKFAKFVEVELGERKYYLLVENLKWSGHSYDPQASVAKMEPTIFPFHIKARNLDECEKTYQNLKEQYAYKSIDGAFSKALDDIDKLYSLEELFYKVDFNGYKLPDIDNMKIEIKCNSTTYYVKSDLISTFLTSKEDAENEYQSYMGKRQNKIDQIKLAKKKRLDRIDSLMKLQEQYRIQQEKIQDSIYMSVPLNITCRINDERQGSPAILIKSNKTIQIPNLHYVFVYNAKIEDYRIKLYGYHYYEHVIIDWNRDWSFNSFVRDNGGSEPSIRNFLLRNEDENIENRKNMARLAAMNDRKTDSITEVKTKILFNSLKNNKIVIVREGRDSDEILHYTLYNCFSKTITSFFWQGDNGEYSMSDGWIGTGIEPGNLRNFRTFKPSSYDCKNLKLTKLTIYFGDNSNITYSGSQIKLHTKICLDENNNWIID